MAASVFITLNIGYGGITKMIFLENPAKRKRAAKRTTKRRKKRRPPPGGWKKYMAKIRGMKKGATKKRRRRVVKSVAKSVVKRRRTRARRKPTATAATGKGHTMARRRKARKSAPRRHRRRYHRNPPIMSTLKRGVVDGVGVVAGGAVLRLVRQRVPLPAALNSGPGGAAVNLVLAAALGTFAAKFVPARVRSMFVAGAFGAAVEDSVASLGLRIPGLSAYPYLSAYPEYGALSGYGPESGADGTGMQALPISGRGVTDLPPFSPFGANDVPQMGIVQQYD